MDFNLPETATAVRDGVAAIGARYDHSYWDRCEQDKRWPAEVWAELAKGGWLGLCVPQEYGGGGQGLLDLAVATETLSSSGAGSGSSFIYLLTPGFGALTISTHGTEEQKRELLPGLAAGELQTCFAITEPDAGSDALRITTQARRDGSDFLVRGQKVWITGVQRADYMLLVTRTIPAADAKSRTSGFTVLLVDVKEAAAAGTLTYQPIPKLGWNTAPSNMVFLDDVRVPSHRVLGEVDRGFAVLWDILNPERIIVAASAVGAATAALEADVRLRARARGLRPSDRREPGDRLPARADQGQDGTCQADDLQGGLAVRQASAVRERGQHCQTDRHPGVVGSGRPRLPDVRRDGLFAGLPGCPDVPRREDRADSTGNGRADPGPHRYARTWAPPHILNGCRALSSRAGLSLPRAQAAVLCGCAIRRSGAVGRQRSALAVVRVAFVAKGAHALADVGAGELEELERERRVEGRPGLP